MTYKLFYIIAFSIYLPLQAQFTNIMISDNYTPNEPSIAIDPNNTNRLVAGANLKNYYFSNDGGYTWTSGLLVSPSYGVWGDPCVMVDNQGDYYFFHLSNPPEGNWVDRIVCQKYSDNNWNDGTYFGLNGNKVQDKEWVCYDRINDIIYATWTEFDQYNSSNPEHKSRIMFVKSTDKGQTWTTPVKINEVDGDCIDSDNTVEGAVPAVGPDGEIYVAWSGPEGIQFSRSTNQGISWSENIQIDPHPGGWDISIPGIYRANGMPITLCDTSGGEHNGTLYVSWGDQRNGTDNTDIWIKKSTDEGNTWSEAIKVNNDSGNAQQFLHWMTIDQTNGYLYAIFYDRRNHNNNLTDVYLARSTDGGETFQNYKISEEPFLPDPNIFFGDYTNITAHNGIIRPIWMSMNYGELKLWTAIINEDMLVSTPEANDHIDLHASFPNPASTEAYIPFKLNKSCQVELYISDVRGHRIATLIRGEHYLAGKYVHKVSFTKYRITKGIYFYTLHTNSKTYTGKIIVE